MNYAISDIHGCAKEFNKLLKLINFNDNDTLYILGDVIDRGEKGISLLLELSNMKNVIPILGNHEYMAKPILRIAHEVLNDFEKESGLNTYFNEKMFVVLRALRHSDYKHEFKIWVDNGGINTLVEFVKLPSSQRSEVLDYLYKFDLYAELSVNGKSYMMLHAGIPQSEHIKNKSIEDYDERDLLWTRDGILAPYFIGKTVIVGHTPTPSIELYNEGSIIKTEDTIDIDCGCVFGYRLAAYCLETEEEFYVNFKG